MLRKSATLSFKSDEEESELLQQPNEEELKALKPSAGVSEQPDLSFLFRLTESPNGMFSPNNDFKKESTKDVNEEQNK